MSYQIFAQLLLMGSAGLFTGVLLFAADVLQRIFYDMTEKEFARFMTLLYKRGGYSVFAVVSQSIPFFGMFIYVIIFGFSDTLFLVGLLVWNLALVTSRFTNAPVYKQIIATDPSEKFKLRKYRKALQRGNHLRAVIALVGFMILLFHFYQLY